LRNKLPGKTQGESAYFTALTAAWDEGLILCQGGPKKDLPSGCRNYGYAKLSELVAAIGLFSTERRENKVFIKNQRPK
jgi:hypothetical protein